MAVKTMPASEQDQLRALIRQAHEAAKDLRAEIRLLEEKRADLLGDIDEVCKLRLTSAVEAFAKVFGEKVDEFWDHAQRSVPIQVLCSNCHELSVALAEPDAPMSCGGCGMTFLLKATLGRQIRAGQRQPSVTET